MQSQLVGWSLTSLFSTNTAISEMKGRGWRVILSQWRKASHILTSTLATFLFSSHPKRERDPEAHLNYYANTYNRGRQLLHHTTKLNQIQQNTRINLNSGIQITQNKHNKLNPGSVGSYDLGLETEWDYSGRKGRDGQKKKIGKANEKRKRGKVKTEQKMRKWMDKGEKGEKRVPQPYVGHAVPALLTLHSTWSIICHKRLLEKN